MLLLGLKRLEVDRGMRCRTAQDVGDGVECAQISQRQPLLLLSFRGQSVPSPQDNHTCD
jgi:hypothetical protein